MGQNEGGSGRSSTSKTGRDLGPQDTRLQAGSRSMASICKRRQNAEGVTRLPRRGADPGWPTPGGIWPPGCVSQDPRRAVNPGPELPSPKDRE